MSKAACGSACGNGGGEIYFIATERNVKTSRRNARKRALQSGRQPPPLKSRDPDSRNLRLYTSCKCYLHLLARVQIPSPILVRESSRNCCNVDRACVHEDDTLDREDAIREE